MNLPPDMFGHPLTVRTVAAPRLEVGSTTITPLAKVLSVSCRRGLLIRSRPAALLVSTKGQVSRVRITDMTRVAQVVVLVLTALSVGLLLTQAFSRKEQSP